MLPFNPKATTKELLAGLPDRSRKVLADRFGLAGKGDERTLDAIGKEYGITRERVRQIENHGLISIRESKIYEAHGTSWEAMKRIIDELGELVSEHHLLESLAKNDADRKHLIFLLTVSHHFDDRKENENFRARWFTRNELANQVERALAALYETIEPSRLMTDDEFIQTFARLLKEEGAKNRTPDVLQRYLFISKKIGRNPLGEWGRTESPQVRIKNTRDFAFLTLKRHGSPMHFTEVATGIDKLFGRKTHPATTHNELIKDGRFVLVGRGLYALKEWGYEPGVVRDVIKNILAKEGALSREEIIDRVKRERYVKDATIAVNLQNGIFTKLADGRYALAR